ncbi:MAG: ATP phosphoribosyltransferase regulatory subunit, partial [Campylobacterales bacterium]|nr:ATP phosphoribosyltransferase regulatory subunit [Campylobacterales bacterium]
FVEVAQTTATLLQKMEETPIMQISNIRIPHLLNEKYGVSLEVLKSMHIEQIMKAELPWIEQLVKMHRVEDLDDLGALPYDIREELEKIKEAVSRIEYPKVVISPLFYAKMRYYDSLTFRMFEGNALIATGGTYSIDGVEAAGFALYTDECIASKISKGM